MDTWDGVSLPEDPGGPGDPDDPDAGESLRMISTSLDRVNGRLRLRADGRLLLLLLALLLLLVVVVVVVVVVVLVVLMLLLADLLLLPLLLLLLVELLVELLELLLELPLPPLVVISVVPLAIKCFCACSALGDRAASFNAAAVIFFLACLYSWEAFKDAGIAVAEALALRSCLISSGGGCTEGNFVAVVFDGSLVRACLASLALTLTFSFIIIFIFSASSSGLNSLMGGVVAPLVVIV
jgi:hypothetical protein